MKIVKGKSTSKKFSNNKKSIHYKKFC